uniref:CCHC-type domain-containing protein n=1 Tax=Tanacetum cinerariifolium TaxID=118510 RepID=A0A699HPF2_TANCI|nr:hypothetical protein [Tanacetum cinerariifolium]
MTTTIVNNSLFRSLFEKQKLTGNNFMEWYRNLKIVLSIEDKLTFLEQPIPVLPVPSQGQANPPAVIATHQAWVKVQKEIVGLMLMTMDPEIQKTLKHLDAYDMLQELKMLYVHQVDQELLQTVREFHACKQEEKHSVSSYVRKMKSYIDNLERLGHAMTQNLSVSFILVSLRKEYDSFVQNYNMHSIGKTEGSIKTKKKKSHKAAKGNQGKGKAEMGYAPMEAPPFSPKPKNPSTPKKDNPAKDAICHQCGVVGHWRRNCPIYLLELMKKKKLSQGASTLEKLQHDGLLDSTDIKSFEKCVACMSGYPKKTIGYSFYYPPENKVFVARNDKFLKNSLIHHKASRSLDDLEIIQDEDTHHSLDTSLNYEEDDQEIDESQSDINLIRRSTRTRHPTDRLCLYVNAEEHELGDLGEPANYKAALLDLESEKCLNAMNVEMQSMKDNKVWELVVLHLNGKVIGHKWLFKKKTDMDGAVHTYKARLVAKGITQTPGIDYEETFSLVANIRAIRILIAITAFYDYEIWQMDVKTAFLNGYLNEEVYIEKPKGDAHWTVVKNILKYLRNTKDMFLVYGGDMKRELRVSYYTNARYLTDADDMKSQTGYVFVLNRGVADWKSTKQSIFATSSTDAEYITAFDASKEAVWIRKFIFGLGVVPIIEEPINMYCDNTVAIAIAKDHRVTKGARHFHAKVHYLRETIEIGDVRIEKVDTYDNLADPFTKALAFPKHFELTEKIGMIPTSSLM